MEEVQPEVDKGADPAFAVNQDMARTDAMLKAGDEVAFFPPVTGG